MALRALNLVLWDFENLQVPNPLTSCEGFPEYGLGAPRPYGLMHPQDEARMRQEERRLK